MTNFNTTPAAEFSNFKRCAFYGRYSTKMQRPASIEDQLRSCNEFAAMKGWQILDDHIYKDAALSGATKNHRTGLKALEIAAETRPRPFDYILFDDTSRLGRDQADVLTFVKVMKHHGIGVHFVSQQLDSSSETFEILLNTFSMVDSMYNKRLRSKVLSGQKGRVLNGFHVGSIPYGYRSEVVENTDDPSAIGRAASLGSKLKVVKEQAEVVRRIFTLFVDGHAMWAISRKLNREGVPSPQNTRAGKQKSEWSRDAIRHILRNEKYRGQNVWNVSYQDEHPTSGRLKKELKSPHEHVRVQVAHLRIVDDELWFKASERMKEFEDKQKVRVLGGYSRAKEQPYLYSGLLYCGSCESRMKIGGKQGFGMYECPNHRQGRGCTNGLRIREERLSKQLTEALASQLFDPEYLDDLVTDVFTELKEVWRKQQKQASKEAIPQLEEARRNCQVKIENLIDAIENGGPQRLTVQLAKRQFELEQIENKLKIARGTAKLTVTKEQLETLVRKNVASLVDVLKTDVPLARKILHRYFKKLFLFPDVTGASPMIMVLGEIDLFRAKMDENDGVLQGCEGTLTPQQHTDSYYRFVMLLYPTLEECPIVEPLYQLLLAQPELSLEPRTPGVWAKLLRDALGEGGNCKRPLGSGAIGRCFGRHRHILEQKLNIVKSKYTTTNGWHYKVSVRHDASAVDSELLSSAMC